MNPIRGRSSRPRVGSVALLLVFSWLGGASVPAAESDALFRRSLVALMPEGEPESIDEFRPLRPGIVAWGIDALGFLERPTELRKHLDAYRAIGVEWLACNVWMLTATPRVLHDDPRFQEAVCRDITGAPIVPPWLDDEYQGMKSYWGCTNHPLFREQLIARAQAGIEAGANLLHLDDHLGTAAAAEHSGGCFCEHCLTRFAHWLRARPAAERDDLPAEALSADFNYRDFLHRAGLSTRAAYDEAVRDNRVPLRSAFLTFQREAAADFVRELGAVAARTAGRRVPVGVNAWNLAPTQLATAHHADYFANEIRHHGVEDLEPPRAYLLAEALDKRVFGTGTGEDWIDVMLHDAADRVPHWIALAHAFGQHFMYAYRKWAFSQETGTRWYQTPIETYAPLFTFIREHPELFDRFETAPQIGVLYDNRAQREQRADVGPILRELHDAHLSAGLAVAGDEWLHHTLTIAELERFELVVVPDGIALDAVQDDALRTQRERGRIIPWRGIDDLRTRIKPWIECSSSTRLWTLPRINRASSRPRVVIHLLQPMPPDTATPASAPASGRLTLAKAMVPDATFTRATWHQPGAISRPLPLIEEQENIVIEFPSVALWAVLELE